MNVTTQAINKVERNADEQWIITALFIIYFLAIEQTQFTADMVWEEFEHYPTVTTHEPRAMGAVMRKAQKIGFISRTSFFVNSNRTSCHNGPKRIWKSNYDKKTGQFSK
jgi:hypothetical protein